MPKLVLSIAPQSNGAIAVQRVGCKNSPALRIVERDPTLPEALREAMDAAETFGQVPARCRRLIERTVDALLTVLDCMDADPDMEPEEDRGELDYLPDAPRAIGGAA
ncbi:hypothetical protein SAMN02982917_0560 [Azospirillum oryzae]|uniref:Uncharacterized protein n=1 Tax=Azospirillum oryzae TaxID=286727 RepID=A0A1X7HT47_9PROT|nr:hypothetical protein [Azospirillum oryzae]SMF92320.1 hypothetical protein SAMN02982917_0560 [Azospirillum oryzae]